MKIEQVKVYVVETDSYRPVIVELIADDGSFGIGEAAVGFGVGCYAACSMIRELSEAFVLNRDPGRITEIWNNFYYQTFWGKGGGPIFYAAVSAIETALWDLKGKMLGVPVYELLGGCLRSSIPCYANGWSKGDTPEYFAERAKENLDRGFHAMKMYPLNIIDRERHINGHHTNRQITQAEESLCIKKIESVRNVIGHDCQLMLDFTAEVTPDVIIRLGRKAAEFMPYYIEEPADPFDPEACRKIRDALQLPVAAGERVCTRYGFARLIEKRAVDIVQPDPGIAGGLLESFRIASHAETYSMRVAPHNCGGPLLTAMCIQLDACLPNFTIQEVFPYLSDAHYYIVENPLEKSLINGCIPVPTKPGLGVDLNRKEVAPFCRVTLSL